MCIRLKALKTKDQLDIARDLAAKGKADDAIESQLETITRCLIAHTDKRPWIFKKAPKKDERGNDTAELVDTEFVDTDAMLEKIKPAEWIADNPLSLRVEGTSVTDVLSFIPDYKAACDALGMASGFGSDRPLVKAALTTVSVG
jgi:hypothetical protein